MNKGFFIISVISANLLVACLSDEQKKEKALNQARLEFETLDTSAIDQYPLFDDCDEMITTADCFYDNMHYIIDLKLKAGKIPIRLQEKDSIYAAITVSKEGMISYDSIARCAQAINKEEMHLLLQERLTNLPLIKSATKRSIPVSSSYLLPIIFTPVDSLEY